MSINVSIIVVAYNSRGDLEKCLPSLLATCDANTEIIVVDNASEDDTSAWIGETFSSIRVVHSQGNLGFGGGNNLGAQAARGEYLVFLNPDTTVEMGWFDILVSSLKDDPQIGLATSRIMLMQDPKRINTCGNDIHISGTTLCRGFGETVGVYSEPAEVGAVSGAAFAIHRELFDKLCGFDESFFMYLEDTDLSLRARLLGYRSVCVPGSVVYHRYILRFGPQKTFYQERNRYLMFLKCLRWTTLLALLPLLLLTEMMTWGFVLLREPKNWRNKWKAYTWILLHKHEIQARRKNIQSQRTVSDHELLSVFKASLDFEQVNMGWTGQAARFIFNPLFTLYSFLIKRVI